jgi:hypothetical protein
MAEYLQKLLYRFRKQEEFSADYSPLYAAVFGTIAKWLADAADPVTEWLLAASNGRSSFDVPLLLVAALHREVLLGTAPALAEYYPSVGGERPFTDSQFPTTLHQAILAHRAQLAPFIQTATVQTNETGRGLCWLLPLHAVNWEAVHLVDLGASAGLNLVAEQRAYRLVMAANGRVLADLGQAPPTQFITHCRHPLSDYPVTRLPHIVSRTGCDIQPFLLETDGHEQTLAAYVWPDQVHRLHRLREGIAAFRATQPSAAPVTLHQATLPDGLPHFLRLAVPQDNHPVVLYNTYITQYLPQKGQLLRQHLTDWATSQARPILWLQWEPDRAGADAPEYGWLLWTADLWHNQTHQQFSLGWIHPHGAQAQFEPGLQRFAQFFA